MNELGFVREKELFDTMLKTQEENEQLRKAYNICDEANIDLNAQLDQAKEIINELLMNSYDENTREKALNFCTQIKRRSNYV